MWYTILLSSRIWHKITFGNFCYDYSLLLPHRWTINPVLALCGALSYELYLVHMQMLGMVHSSLSAWMILLISMLIAFSLQKFLKQLQNFILK